MKKLRCAYGEHTVSRAQAFKLHKAFKAAVRLWKANLVLKVVAR
jgi:predicted GIY-YIG superfamily endonuclease